MLMRATAVIAALIGVGALASCGSGKGKGGNEVIIDVAQTRAFYQVLDLPTGGITPVGSIPDLMTNPAYRSTLMAFRLMDTTSGQVGSAAGQWAAQSDEVAQSVGLSKFYLGIFEVTQGQWQAITGTTPWSPTTLLSDTSSDDIKVGLDYPAVGLPYDTITAALAAYASTTTRKFRLPTESEWEYGCRAKNAGPFCWGSDLSSATVNSFAVVWENANLRVGPAARGASQVGGRSPNAFGLYDVHGNVWEMTAVSAGVCHLRGGSWNDPLSLARSANRTEIETLTANLSAGLRLVYVP